MLRRYCHILRKDESNWRRGADDQMQITTRGSSMVNSLLVFLHRKVVCDPDLWTRDLHNSQSAFCDHTWSCLKIYQFIGVPNCTLVVNVVKFPHAVCEILCSQSFSTRSRMESPKTERLQLLIAGSGIRKEGSKRL